MTDHPRRRRVLAALGAGAVGLTGCSGFPDGDGVAPADVRPTVRKTAYTHGRPNGNRFVEGPGAVGEATPIDVPLEGTPRWVVGLPTDRGSVWLVALTDGRVEGVALDGDGPRPVAFEVDRLPRGAPPALVGEDGVRVLARPDDVARRSVPVRHRGATAYVDADGGLVIVGDDGRTRHRVAALPDARVVAGGGNVVTLGGATDRYPHGALGDDREAGTLVVASTASGELVRTTPAGTAAVFEAITPLTTEWHGEEVHVLPRSDDDDGARIAAYRDGRRVAAGPGFGTGFRWRHRIAIAPFGPDGRRELVAVRTPHVGGVVQFYRRDGDRLRIVARESGYASHEIGSRNLDGALAGDVDGDGRPELLAPIDGRRRLGAVRRGGGGARTVFRVPIGGSPSTNLAGAGDEDGATIALGRTDDALRVWPGRDEG